MTAIAYVNGAYIPLACARAPVLDRAFMFADAVYEVWGVREGQLMDNALHYQRLRRSLSELRIAAPMSDASLDVIVRETVRRNRVRNGLAYLQISRGVAPRDHAFPTPPVKASIVVTAKTLDQTALANRLANGVKVITTPETRWARCDIKSTSLLPNVLAKQQAREEGAYEAWFVDGDGMVVEGTSSTAWIVDDRGRVRTRDLSNALLHGVTRATLIDAARRHGCEIIEQAFSVSEAKAAREAFMTAAVAPLIPIVTIDAVRIGEGRPGPITAALRAAYLGAATSD